MHGDGISIAASPSPLACGRRVYTRDVVVSEEPWGYTPVDGEPVRWAPPI